MREPFPSLLCTSLLLFAATLPAQQTPASSAGMGTVTGRVTCADTGRPARFATVALLAVPRKVTQRPDLSDAKMDVQMVAALRSLSDLGSTNMVQTGTGFDGLFTATNVAPGDYYAFAAVPGYVQPVNALQAAVAAGADLNKPLSGVPVVHVNADRSSSVEVSAERGASVSGKVLWDDGSPVAHAVVTLIPPTGKEHQVPPQFGALAMMSVTGGGLAFITDDRGSFRIAGLAPGEYDLKASLTTGMQFGMGASGGGFGSLLHPATPLVVYGPASVHRSDAKPFKLQAGEDLGDQQITFALGRMRTVSGRVTSLEDHHGINSASVLLVDAADKEFKRSAGVDAQGNYTVDFVPPGTYNLTVEDAEDTRPSTKKTKSMFGQEREKVRSYEDATSSVIVGDSNVTGKDLAMAAEKPGASKKEEADLEKLMKDLDDREPDTPASPAPPPQPRD